MADNSQTKQRTPKALQLKIHGMRGGFEISGFNVEALLTSDGKLDRNIILRGGRNLEDPIDFEIHADKKPVCRITRDETQWTITMLSPEGKSTGKKVSTPRADVKRSKRKNSALPPGVDPGPDLLKAVTFAVGQIWPEMQTTARPGGKSAKAQLNAAQSQLLELAKQLAIMRKKDLRDIVKELGLTLPENVINPTASNDEDEDETEAEIEEIEEAEETEEEIEVDEVDEVAEEEAIIERVSRNARTNKPKDMPVKRGRKPSASKR